MTIINAWTQTKTVKELEELMDEAGVPSGLIYPRAGNA